jgi:crotonobetainyl-CoA:carnitine CoA-transferase CaiB-like acyl-CoA transferase
MTGPLDGVRIFDLTGSFAGPFCTQTLGALGADVIKIERPGRGDDARAWGPPFWDGESAAFLAMNANKRSVTIDLSSTRGLALAERLVTTCDVFVENLRPGVCDRLGLGFERVAELRPDIVYCSIGAYGRVGPQRLEPGYDPLVQAASGIMSMTGEPDGLPVRAGVSLIDLGTGVWSIVAILAAITARDRGARAQRVDTSLYETAINLLGYQITGYLGTGTVPRPMGTAIAIIAPYEAFRAADGWLMIAAGNDAIFSRLCTAIARPALAADLRFCSNASRVAHRDELAAEIGLAIKTQSVATWTDTFTAARVPIAPISDLAEMVAATQTEALGILQPLAHPHIDDCRVVAPPVSTNGQRIAHRSPPPTLGADTSDVLAELGLGAAEVADLRSAGVVG